MQKFINTPGDLNNKMKHSELKLIPPQLLFVLLSTPVH